MKDSLLIYSGGLDSTSLLYAYKENIALCVHFNYGSKHNEQEVKMARKNCKFLDIPLIEIDITNIGKHLKSNLLKGGGDIPEGRYDEPIMSKTVVPFRNGIMLSIATGIAESNNLSYVLIASHTGDHAIYPDCTVEFNEEMDKVMRIGSNGKVYLWTPFENLDKKEVAQIGIKAGMNPDWTYSCYKGGDKQCGVCSTCRERDWALGLRKDP